MLRVLLWTGAAIGALLLCVLIAAGIWGYSNREELVRFWKEAEEKGEAFGREHTSDECVLETYPTKESLAPPRSYSDVIPEMKRLIFLGKCFEFAVPPPGFCTGLSGGATDVFTALPQITEFCARLGIDDERCGRATRGMVKACVHHGRVGEAPVTSEP